ncbi:MAG TPA: hypothetical protein VNA65_03225 [Candidatus Dormibacteraeota bacterium]|nr:hypothetical protein [Candidatus Dormibacteraeota bacterium]
MRSAVLQLPTARTQNEKRQVMRAAIRQLDRAELYLAALAYMELDDLEAERAVNKLRSNLDGLRRYLVARRSALRD